MRFIEALREVLSKHGKPTSEDAAWHTMIHVQVLQLELLEKIMASLQDLASVVANEGTALDDLKRSVTAYLTAAAAPPAPAGLSAADQAAVDAAHSTAQANIQTVAEIKALLGSPAAPAPAPAPAPSPAPAPAPAAPTA